MAGQNVLKFRPKSEDLKQKSEDLKLPRIRSFVISHLVWYHPRRDTDDLIAMGTIWSPNVQQNQQQQQQQQQIPYKNSSSHTSSANSMTNTILNNGSSSKFLTANSAGGSTSSTAIGQPQLRKNNVINSSGVKSIMVNNAPFSGVKNNLRDRDSKEIDPKYIDPIVGSQASFQQRIMELSALESETIRYEKTKRLKKKVKQDRDS
ncbi:hypothetical protein KUTeg_016007 [Tegillarca granosa]|uniref:Uncharacterized protein n=1 Tax=Tegillarca granosa TaxID=220873 RepID=A0ABQ9ENF7_TEGGR|nr:hypothetical protein KUTeg_016007 [Tegillarca granosa]